MLCAQIIIRELQLLDDVLRFQRLQCSLQLSPLMATLACQEAVLTLPNPIPVWNNELAARGFPPADQKVLSA